ncbi:MAG TPA: Ig-like domain-containing protein [Gemmatimonadaceae bacterium]|nr:Ig-like domain-containing protein [Gemmatimonadaceae bacterium]
MRRQTFVLSTVLLAALSVTADAQVRFERTGYRLTSIGERVTVSARAQGTTPIRWHISDPGIASVTARGVVEAKKAGYTRLWAVAGDDSASAIILVDQWAARFDFYPSVVRLHAVGDSLPLRVQVRDAAGHLIADAARRTSSSCHSLNDRVAQLASNGRITARSNGVTYVRCTDRGIADSVRVEVRQRAASAVISDKLGFANRVVGDTFRLRVTARDASGGEIRDVRATWASVNSGIVAVDPLSGLARSVSPGETKIVAQVGDITDTVAVAVVAGSGLQVLMADAGSLPSLSEPTAPTLRLQNLYLIVGDTARVTPKDGAGAAMNETEFRLSSNDERVVAAISGQRVVALRPGNTYVVAQAGSIRDSLVVSIREKADPSASATEVATTVAFVRPTFNIDSARAHNASQLDSASRAIRRQSVVAVYSGRMIGISALVIHAGHATRDTNFLDKRTGLLYGGTAEIAPHRRIRMSASLRAGTLSPTGSSGEELDVTEAEADITLSPAPWFGLRGGYVRRVTKTELATQRWEFPKASAVARFNFVGGAITTITGISVLPGAKYTGYLDAQGDAVDPDPFSVAGEAGLELHSGSFTAALLYYAERFSFPTVNNAVQGRTDQFSALRLRVGFQMGR